MWLWIRLLIFMQLTTERDNQMQLCGWRISQQGSLYLLLIWEHVWDTRLTKIYHFVSLIRFLGKLADLVICLDSRIAIRKNCALEYCTALYRVTARFLVKENLSNIFLIVSEHMGTSNLAEKCIKNIKESAIADHLLQCDSLQILMNLIL